MAANVCRQDSTIQQLKFVYIHRAVELRQTSEIAVLFMTLALSLHYALHTCTCIYAYFIDVLNTYICKLNNYMLYIDNIIVFQRPTSILLHVYKL